MENKKIPEIRFKGFNEEWEQCELKDLSESLEYGLNTSAVEYDGKHKYLRITDIDDNTNEFIQDGVTSPDIDFEEADKYILTERDVLFARTGASVGKTYLYRPSDGLVYYAGFLIRARILEDFSPEFVFQNTLTKRYRQFIDVSSQRSGQPGVNAKEYGEFEIMVPSLEEQEKLGLFFRKIDQTITLHQRKIAKLQQIKDGLLLKMFPREGEVVPEIRFEGFTDPWEQRKLGDLVNSSSGFTGDANLNDGKYRLTRIETIANGTVNEERVGYTNEQPPESYLLESGDILYSNINSIDHIGKVALYHRNEQPLYHGINLLKLKPNKEIQSDYLFHFLNSRIARNWAEVHANKAVSQASINQSSLSKQLIAYCSIEEQERISTLFNKIDETITLHQRKCEKLKQIKESLLVKMFV